MRSDHSLLKALKNRFPFFQEILKIPSMDKNPETVSKMFDRISPSYDRVNRILSFGLDMRWRRKLAQHLPNEPFKLLDLATGTGDQIFALLKNNPPLIQAIGLDFSEKMLEIARVKCSDRRISFIHGDAQQLPFANQTFDVATFSFGIRNVANPLSALSEIARVLKPKGRCLILEFSLPKRKLFCKPYVWYLRTLLPRLGGWISKDVAAYRYLNQTIEAFASGEEFLTWMRNSGFKTAKSVPILFGSVSLYVGEA